MGDLQLYQPLFGSAELAGKIDALSSRDSAALRSAAAGIDRVANVLSLEAAGTRLALEGLGWGMAEVSRSVASLGNALVLSLDAQTQLLNDQSVLLDDIRRALLTPAKTRAAERVADACGLLRRHRFERAEKLAEEAVDADPNNPDAFIAAGWARLGQGRLADAREMFEEAADAADGDVRGRSLRQAGRIAFAQGEPGIAHALVTSVEAEVSAEEHAALSYDRALYARVAALDDDVVTLIEEACELDSRYCLWTLCDQEFAEADDVRTAASNVLKSLQDEIADQEAELGKRLASLLASLPDVTDLPAYEDLAQGIRPANDYVDALRDLKTERRTLLDAVAASRDEVRLQTRLRVLDETTARVAELEAKVPGVAADVRAFVAAVRREEKLDAEWRALNAEYEKLARSRATWFGKQRLTELKRQLERVETRLDASPADIWECRVCGGLFGTYESAHEHADSGHLELTFEEAKAALIPPSPAR